MKQNPQEVGSDVRVKGFFRVQIENQDGSLSGDSGWIENKITNDGFRFFIVQLMINSANSSRVSHIALGTGTEPGDASTNLVGEAAKRKAVTASEIASKTVQFLATFGSSDSFVAGTSSLNNIGLFATSTQGAGTIFAGNTYASSQIATNQNVNVTYQIRFATA